MRRMFTAALFGLVAGCAATPDDFTQFEKTQAQSMRAYAVGEVSPPHKTLAKVSSNSCDSKTTARYAGDRDEALQLLRLEAVRVGGTMVVDYSCATKGVDWVSNCWASQRCEGMAAVPN